MNWSKRVGQYNQKGCRAIASEGIDVMIYDSKAISLWNVLVSRAKGNNVTKIVRDDPLRFSPRSRLHYRVEMVVRIRRYYSKRNGVVVCE
jgi:hypothetical protein